MSEGQLCDREGCKQYAKYKVRLSLRGTPNHKPAISDPILCVCEEHSKVEWRDVVGDDGWMVICANFRKAGYQQPIKALSKVVLEPLDLQPKKAW